MIKTVFGYTISSCTDDIPIFYLRDYTMIVELKLSCFWE